VVKPGGVTRHAAVSLQLHTTERNPVRKPNYQFEKRNRELEKQKKKAAKADKKASAKSPDTDPSPATSSEPEALPDQP
jgi:hypothetical protein